MDGSWLISPQYQGCYWILDEHQIQMDQQLNFEDRQQENDSYFRLNQKQFRKSRLG